MGVADVFPENYRALQDFLRHPADDHVGLVIFMLCGRQGVGRSGKQKPREREPNEPARYSADAYDHIPCRSFTFSGKRSETGHYLRFR